MDDSWQQGYRHAEEYSRALKGRKWSAAYISPDGFRTGEWIRAQTRQEAKKALPADKRSSLVKLGFIKEQRMMMQNADALMQNSECRMQN